MKMSSSLLQVLLQLASYLFYSLVHIFFYYLIYILAVTSVKSVYKVITQVYNGRPKTRPSSDRAILITGATSGIGLALSKYFSAQGYTVIAGYYTDQEAGYSELVQLNQDKGGKSIFLVHMNVRSQESIKESYEKVSEIMEENRMKLYALVNNAGITQLYRAQWTRRSDIIAMAETNFIGPMLMVRQYMPMLIKTPGSRIVNVSSAAGRLPFPYNVVYCATKAGLTMFSNAVSLDISKHNVKVVTIYLGYALHHTAMANQVASEASATYEEFSPEERALYASEFRGYERGLKALEQFIRDFQADATKADMNIKLPPAGLWLVNCFEISLGAVKRKIKLEDSCFMDAFDNAINMRHPPSEMFAGNRFYAILMSSFLDTVGHDAVLLINSLGSSIVNKIEESIVKQPQSSCCALQTHSRKSRFADEIGELE